MNHRLEQFVRDHREEFDAEEPDKKIWEKISAEVTPPKKKQGGLIRLNPVRWSAAAAVILVMVGMGWYLSNRTGKTPPVVANRTAGASNNLPTPGSGNPAAGTVTPPAAGSNKPSSELAAIRPKTSNGTDESDNSMDEEMYHYARLVEIKHNQLKAIEKDEPLLYRQFASDVSKLDSVYHNLQSQLPKNPNREQLLEAMLQNLQLQMGLLNHQLDIIKQINHSKMTEYEKAHKTA
jgi:hypothetical protein